MSNNHVVVRLVRPRCEPCTWGMCHDPDTTSSLPAGPHTWMDKEDAEHKGLTWPLTPENAAAHPCPCECTGGPGGCTIEHLPT